MLIPRFWSRACVDAEGREQPPGAIGFVAYGWSDASEADAHRRALDRAARVARWWRDEAGRPGDEGPPGDYYERPTREAIVDEVREGDRRAAAITRNAYGAYVLNTATMLFADIDAPGLPLVATSWWKRLLGQGDRAAPRDDRNASQKSAALVDALSGTFTKHGLAGRLYRTAAGYRAVVTSRPYDPASLAARHLLEAMKSDARYVDLCRVQRCFRARVSPKPWRVGIDRPPARFPFADDRAAAAFDRWDRDYQQRCRGHAACEPVAELNGAAADPALARVLTIHDELACTPGPLA